MERLASIMDVAVVFILIWTGSVPMHLSRDFKNSHSKILGVEVYIQIGAQRA